MNFIEVQANEVVLIELFDQLMLKDYAIDDYNKNCKSRRCELESLCFVLPLMRSNVQSSMLFSHKYKSTHCTLQ